MSDAAPPTPAVPPRTPHAMRFGNRSGCILVILALIVTGAAALWTLRRPFVGAPALLLVIAADVLLLRWMTRRERAEQFEDVTRYRSIALPRGDAWRRLLAAEGLAGHQEIVAPSVRPALRLTPARADDLSIGASRVGGVPDLPADVPWPGFEGQPLAFLAQFDLAEVASTLPDSPLPGEGHVWFFLAADPWKFDEGSRGSFRCVYRAASPLSRARAPEGLGPGARFPACALSLEAYEDLPHPGPPHLPDSLLTEEEDELYHEVRAYLSSGGGPASSKLLGHANAVQDTMELDCELAAQGLKYGDPSAQSLVPASARWRLLLQLDSEPEASMNWGDGGMLYFWITDEDLRAGRFDCTQLVFQCY